MPSEVQPVFAPRWTMRPSASVANRVQCAESVKAGARGLRGQPGLARTARPDQRGEPVFGDEAA
ncbi:hypothetical protein ACWDSD_45960, partial [Streptomyces spiralis]